MCQVIAWLFVAELNLIFCGLLKEYQIMDSLRLFGLTIETILIVGQLLRITGVDFFDFLWIGKAIYYLIYFINKLIIYYN